MRLPHNIEQAIAEFRGLPLPDFDERHISAKPLDSLIEVLIERHSIGKLRPEQTIIENWRTLLGDTNAHRCSPERIDTQHRLLINVSNPVLRRELMFDRNRLLARIRELEGCGHITAVEFRQG